MAPRAEFATEAGANTAFHPGPASAGATLRPAGDRTTRPVPHAEEPTLDFPKAEGSGKAEGSHTFNNASALAFRPDSTTFRYPAAAAATGKKLAKWLVDNPSGAITVTGTTASAGTKDTRDALCLARAQAVCAQATAAGAGPARLTAIGAGNDFLGATKDILPDGTLDPAAAETNRTVILTFTA